MLFVVESRGNRAAAGASRRRRKENSMILCTTRGIARVAAIAAAARCQARRRLWPARSCRRHRRNRLSPSRRSATATVSNDRLQAWLRAEAENPSPAAAASQVNAIVAKALAGARSYPAVKVATAGYSTQQISEKGKAEPMARRARRSVWTRPISLSRRLDHQAAGRGRAIAVEHGIFARRQDTARCRGRRHPAGDTQLAIARGAGGAGLGFRQLASRAI